LGETVAAMKGSVHIGQSCLWFNLDAAILGLCSSKWWNDERKMNWKGFGRKQSRPNSGHNRHEPGRTEED